MNTKKLAQIFKNTCLTTLVVCPLSSQAKSILDSESLMNLFHLIPFIPGNNHAIDEEALIQAFSEIREGGSSADNSELLDRLIPHLTYTSNADYRSDDFIRKLLTYYNPSSSAYANLPSFPRELLKDIQEMEKYYQEHVDESEEDDFSIEDFERLYQAREEMIERRGNQVF